MNTKFRAILFTIHMWVGLILGVLLAALGLSGSVLVYDDAIGKLLMPPPFAVTQGDHLPVSMLADAAREAAGAKGIHGGPMTITLPQKPAEAVMVRVGGISVMGNMPGMNAGATPRDGGRHRHGREGGNGERRVGGGEGGGRGGLQVFLDPVSGDVLETRTQIQPGILTFAHQLHGNFLMGRDGRSWAVGPLGIAMLILGLTGLVLWWPKRGQWKYAFFVRPTATGLRFHRELHAATGIWIFLVFMAISFSGVVLAWPGAFGAPNLRTMPSVTPGNGAPIGPDQAITLAKQAVPGMTPTSVTIPAGPDQPFSVGYVSNGAINASVLVDPWNGGKVMAVRDQSKSFIAWMRPVHQGSLNRVWGFLTFLSGLVPTLFVVTGIIMWLKKRKRHMPMTQPAGDGDELDEVDA